MKNNRVATGLKFCYALLSMLFLNLLQSEGATLQEPASSPMVMQEEQHGMLSHEMPSELSPDAVKFFSPDMPSPPQFSSHPHQLYAAGSDSSVALEGIKSHGNGISQGAKAGIGLSVLLGVVFAGGGLYVYAKRRSNIKRANAILPNP
ncbi:hypothetical protein SUGI_1127680 [Cryptomeria japonica]|uniref:uncharacterized protein LOC131041099 n=1 Tax=Cryptomeria japonica TaxID=3369 RepID=UPI002414CADE|nr:uncharacterized protein LOC131041099 [Cryptomeria japonica]GLJ52938.1 hypothetical protein SUGI_1127680 [Cryptomeria japonica]